MTLGSFLRVDLWKGYSDSNKVVVTFWKNIKIFVQKWKMNLTWIKGTEIIVMPRCSCD